MCWNSDDDLIAWKTKFDKIRTNAAQNLFYTNIPNLNIDDEGQIVFVIEDENQPYYIKFTDNEGREQKELNGINGHSVFLFGAKICIVIGLNKPMLCFKWVY